MIISRRMDRPNVYTIPGGVDFLAALAEGLKDRLGDRLQDALILLPTRRAIRELGQYLARDGGVHLLPRMRPLADIDPDEPPFEPGYLTGLVDPLLPPARRRFAMAELVGRFHENTTGEKLDAAGMLALADPVLAIFDDAAMEETELETADLLDDIKDRAAAHYQNAATFYQILSKAWPEIIRQDGQMEPMARRVALLNALSDLWETEPPSHPVVIAGSTGTLKATARLMKCVAHLPDGLIILPGLDKNTPDVSWTKITDEHPQKSLDNLIRTIGIKREDVADWQVTPRDDPRAARRRLIAESLVPVEDTADWPGRIKRLREPYSGGDFFEDAIQGLTLVEARTEEDEALSIALILRETLETPEKTAALITPDAALARRVKARLRRWHVDVDYSQGQPLEETAIGGFLSAILAHCEDVEDPVNLADLFNHPLVALGYNLGEAHVKWQGLEKEMFRGARPHISAYQEHELIRALHNSTAPIADMAQNCAADAKAWAEALVLTAELLATSSEESGRARLWVEDAGEKAAGLLEELIAYGGSLGSMDLKGFSRLLGVLMRGRVVRPRFGTHPRLQILGPLEARMLHSDIIVLGGLNEGVWPATPPKLPFLSRNMRRALGLSLPERRFGLAAHDFSMLAAGPRVFLTRSERSESGPAVASRWIWRLKTLLAGAMGEEESMGRLSANVPYLDWARLLDDAGPEKPKAAERPVPKPPVSARWPDGKRQLSITQIKTWIRDPYSIYARKILGLKKLDPLDAEIGPAEYGSAVHKAIEEFTKDHGARLPANAEERLAQYLANHLIDYGFDPADLAREQVRLSRMASELIDHMNSQRETGVRIAGIEPWAKLKLKDLNFTLTGKADLIEQGGEAYQVNDYKTGIPASAAEVAAGFDPQLPLTALMLREGAFEGIRAGDSSDLRYIRVSGTGKGVEIKPVQKPPATKGKSAEDLIKDAYETVSRLITEFDKPETGYPSQPRIKYTYDYSDFDDLARRGEWARAGDDGAEGGS